MNVRWTDWLAAVAVVLALSAFAAADELEPGSAAPGVANSR
jgi:hypothetical protein